jgi:hypothetical protein
VPELPPDFERVIATLVRHDVRFVVVGGLAMVLQGSNHITQDIDVSYPREPEMFERLASALAELHPRLRGAPEGLPFRWDARTIRGGSNFTLVTDAGDLDVLGDLAGVKSFEALWDRAVEAEAYGFRVRVASLDDLIAMKRAAGRDKDRDHIRELESLKKLQQKHA